MKQFKDQLSEILHSKLAIMALVAPLMVALIFGYILSNNQILESNLAVIDLDNSSYSRQLIGKLDASPYVQVGQTFYEPIEPNLLLTNSKFGGVVVLPGDLEVNRYRGIQSSIGLVIDDTMAAATGNLRQGVLEVLNAENASGGLAKLVGMGYSSQQASAVISGLAVQQRSPYNPTSDYINTNVVGFVHVVLFALLLMQTVKIIPQLRAEGRLAEAMKSPLGLLSRVLPYALLFFISTIFALGLLKQFANFRFAGSVVEFALPLFIYTLVSALLGMLLGWTAKEPAQTTSRIMLVVAPSFLLSNFMLPLALMPRPLYYLAQIFPMNWYTKFFKEIAMRGTPLPHLQQELGGFLILLTVILGLLLLFMLREAGLLKKKDGAVNAQIV